MRLLVVLSLVFVASCSWMPGLYSRDKKEVVVPLVSAPAPALVPAPIDKAQQAVSPQYQQQFAPDPLAVNQQQYQLQNQQNQQMMMQAQPLQQAPMQQPQYYYAIPAQPQVLPPQYQQPYYQQPQPIQPQYYAPPPAAPMLGQSMPHTFTTGAQYLESDTQTLPGEDDFPDEYKHISGAPSQQGVGYIKRDGVDGQQTQIQQVVPPLIGQPQQPVLQGR